jgi:ATP phosphoribosyltransferase regulatory subunit
VVRDNQLHTPDGVRDFLPAEMKMKTRTERRIEDVFALYGYQPVSSPTFEFIEVFEGCGGLAPSQIYKFLDRDGAALALRPDMTPAIARIAATRYRLSDPPFRFSYTANTFRRNEDYHGKMREITQMGVELIGVGSDEASAEAVAVAVKSLIAVGVSGFRIDIGSVSFFKAVMERSGLSGGDREKLHEYILDRDFVSAEKMVAESEADAGVKTLFREFPLLIGGRSVLARARSLIAGADAALAQLENIYDLLERYGVRDYVQFDLCMIGHLDYYTSMIFAAYAPGAATSVLDGGRYDRLLSKFGADCPAVGFSIKLNALLDALPAGESDGGEVTLISGKDARLGAMLKLGESLRAKGVRAANDFLASDLDSAVARARIKGYGAVVYFENEDSVVIADVRSGAKREISADELAESVESNGGNWIVS